MKRLLRNAAFRWESLLFLALGAALGGLSFAVNRTAGAAALITALALYALYVCLSLLHYRRMAALADELDRIVHGQESFALDRFSEGELSVLQSELSKLLVALRSQSESLKADRVFLADSLADISHQLKTPLTSMNLAAAMLAEPTLSEERRRELARDLQRQLGRLEWLVTALLKLSRLDAGTVELSPAVFTARDLVDAAAEPLLIALEVRDVALRRENVGDQAIRADLAWCAEAVGNILKNCLEHTPPGGRVTVTAAETSIYVELTVTDTGPGIDPEDLPHLFERFYRGRDAGAQSAGIGLALARTILQSSNATVKAENAHAGGAQFTIRFYKVSAL